METQLKFTDITENTELLNHVNGLCKLAVNESIQLAFWVIQSICLLRFLNKISADMLK